MIHAATHLLQPWKDFPKGLGILLLDEDGDSSSEMRSRLQAMDYVVSVFSDKDAALSAVANKPGGFHLAIVGVSETNSDWGIGFLEAARDLPTILISSNQCLDMTMKYIAHGAVEFLHKPISEEKLRNIWQHVVHKAFNTGAGPLAESLRPVKETLVSRLHLPEEENQAESTGNESAREIDHEKSIGNDKYPAPSTPQLKQGARLVDNSMDCQQDGEESKFVETTCEDPLANKNVTEGESAKVKEEDVSGESNVSSSPQVKDGSDEGLGKGNRGKASTRTRANRKKMKVDWTPDLHKRFVQAVEQLGLKQAIPSRILELMKVDGLTRHNIASHLQKYRIQRRHILPKDDDRMWSQSKNNHVSSMRIYNHPHRPIMSFPRYPPVHPIWSNHPAAVMPMWAAPSYLPPAWHYPPDYWHWKPYPGLRADTWGCPVVPPSPHYPLLSHPQSTPGKYTTGGTVGDCSPQSTLEYQPAVEVIDKIVREAMSNPGLPLPIGLKPPSPDIVLEELSKQGIRIGYIPTPPP
ncbi:hypothetical protein MLD38_015504 [Melastoma candidum]|uniref:Uncharacterized protein n=1 Tax=Melastoma candidum TaxID=119954 RepID=A0ACB9RGF6_9MYRT|nr:hypothetical protein MLD38_015504 [Melastoma candidum]